MDDFFRELRSFLHTVSARLSALLLESPRTVQLTSVLGLAAVLYGIYQLQGQGPPVRGRRGEQQCPRSVSGTAASSSSSKQEEAKPQQSSNAHTQQTTDARGLAWQVRSQLAGVKRVSVSLPGVLLEEWVPADLQEGATLREDAAVVLAEVARHADTYLVTHVTDDTGEATTRGALEAGGVIGTGPGQVPAHRVLFCSTLEGKVSIVRQLEPELHIDGHHQTIEDLKRFMPQLVHVRRSGAPAAAVGSPNVGSSPSLPAIFA